MDIVVFIINVTLLLFLLSIPVGIVLSIIKIIIIIKCHDLYVQYRFLGGSCWGMKSCGHTNCRLRRFCPMYQHAITPEVMTEMDSMLERRRESENMDKQ